MLKPLIDAKVPANFSRKLRACLKCKLIKTEAEVRYSIKILIYSLLRKDVKIVLIFNLIMIQ